MTNLYSPWGLLEIYLDYSQAAQVSHKFPQVATCFADGWMSTGCCAVNCKSWKDLALVLQILREHGLFQRLTDRSKWNDGVRICTWLLGGKYLSVFVDTGCDYKSPFGESSFLPWAPADTWPWKFKTFAFYRLFFSCLSVPEIKSTDQYIWSMLF